MLPAKPPPSISIFYKAIIWWEGILMSGTFLIMSSVPVYYLSNHFLIRCMLFFCLVLKKFNTRFFQGYRYFNIVLFQYQLIRRWKEILNNSQLTHWFFCVFYFAFHIPSAMTRFGSRNACCANKKETLCFAWFFLSFSSSHSKLVFFMNIIYYMYGGKRNITIWLLMWILYVCTEERNKRLCFESVPLSTISSRLTHHPRPRIMPEMEDTNELILQRIKKLNELRSLGINPYSNTFKVKDSSKTIIENYGSLSTEELEARKIRCTLAGRIVAFRSFGKAAFAHLQDGKGRIQIYVKKEVIGEEAYSIFKNIDIGDFIGRSEE